MKKILLSTISLAAVFSVPAFAADEEILRAALKKIEALDSRMSSLEAENKSLRAALNKNKVVVEKAQARASSTETSYSTSLRASVPATSSTNMPAYKSEPVIMESALWAGVYGGINAGYAVGYVNQYVNGSGADATGINLNSAAYNYSIIQGGTAGGQLGYNYTFANHVVLGGELDMNWADINDLSSGLTNGFNVGNGYQHSANADGTGNAYNSYSRLGLNWVGTVRARLGYDLGKFLPYITGGFAYGGLSQSGMSSYYDTSSAYGSLTTGSNNIVSTGWAAGAGAEYMVAENWSLKGEYLYTQLGGISTPENAFASIDPYGIVATSYTAYNTGSFGYHQFRIGFNYHTNWLAGTAASIATKY